MEINIFKSAISKDSRWVLYNGPKTLSTDDRVVEESDLSNDPILGEVVGTVVGLDLSHEWASVKFPNAPEYQGKKYQEIPIKNLVIVHPHPSELFKCKYCGKAYEQEDDCRYHEAVWCRENPDSKVLNED